MLPEREHQDSLPPSENGRDDIETAVLPNLLRADDDVGPAVDVEVSSDHRKSCSTAGKASLQRQLWRLVEPFTSAQQHPDCAGIIGIPASRRGRTAGGDVGEPVVVEVAGAGDDGPELVAF